MRLTYVRSFFMQTIKVLYLTENRVGDGGTQHLADALKTNKVNTIKSLDTLNS